MVAPDDKVPTIVKTIIEVNQTGNPGDGKVFVMPVLDAVRVRTAENDLSAVAED
jgi:nitrogen regulatory protein PII 2